jgi:2-(1,2-epoxy-1,2-dihydrophenyl)acetyl-CoA isomerase
LCEGQPRPTLTLESAEALLRDIASVRSAGAKVLVLTGGSEAWCFGGDIAAFANATDRRAYIAELAEKLHAAVSTLQELDAIVITVVDGTAAGAGLPLAAAGDIVLASSRSRFTLGYTKIGLTPDGGTSMLSASVGMHRLLYAALVNPVVDAATAQEQGLVAEVVPASELMARAEEIATHIARGSATALALTKRVIRAQALPLAREALAREQTLLVEAAGGADAAEGLRAFLERRAPSFP